MKTARKAECCSLRPRYYKRAQPSFPDQITADKFFDEAQFEAYRELGYGTGRYIFENKTLDEIFSDEEEPKEA